MVPAHMGERTLASFRAFPIVVASSDFRIQYHVAARIPRLYRNVLLAPFQTESVVEVYELA